VSTLVCDTEVYANYFLVSFRNVITGNVRHFEKFDGNVLDIETVSKILHSSTIVTFNGNNFDLPILALALTGASCQRIKDMCDAIIVKQMKGWQAADKFRVKLSDRIDHIDLFEVAPGRASLKIYGGKMHSKRMQDLPIEPDALIDEAQRGQLREYCANDLQTTQDLFNYLTPQLQLREAMSAQYEQDLRSKSDAQIAEAVIKSIMYQQTGKKPQCPNIDPGTKYFYQAPDFIKFVTPQLQQILSLIEVEPFYVGANGSMLMPDALKDLKITIGDSQYKLGIGGLHSCETTVAYKADSRYVLIDRDVTSYYPEIILKCGLYPKHLGPNFLTIYGGLVERRVKAKTEGIKVEADSMKTTVNGSFGKLGNRYSALYAPDLMIQVTITGQLALLMLIEGIEFLGAHVISANTDGVLIHCHVRLIDALKVVVAHWEKMTGFTTEETRYLAYYARDVNNYIALKDGATVKLKGAYAPPVIAASSWPNPHNQVCIDAIINLLTLGVPVADTIALCNDVRRFVTIRTVKGGAIKDGVYLGKAVRWIYSRFCPGPISYKINGYTVPRSEGARPVMELPDEVPGDIDRDWYVTEANSILKDIGCEVI
jgi:hypothetical protein